MTQATASSSSSFSLRSEAIVAGACRAFLAHGFDACSMEIIAAEAGVTKKTLYNHFSSKQLLFEAVVRSLCTNIAKAIQPPDTTGDVEVDLAHFCHQFIVTNAESPGCEVYRLGISLGQRFPEFGRRLSEVGTTSMLVTLVDYLDQCAAEGKLAIEDTKAAAEYLLGNMLVIVHRVLFGADFDPDSPLLDDYISGAVAAFCRCYSPGDEGACR